MRVRTRAVLAIGFTSIALVASGCGGGGGTDNQGGGTGTTGGAITMRGCTPQKPLLPGSTSETCGGTVMDAIQRKLVHYNQEDASPENDLAESIDTSDNQNFTIKIKSDAKFSDGTPVTAKSFVDAWNYTAYCKNGQDNSYFFTPIAGYADLQSDAKCTTDPKSKTMSGLKVVDDTTFTIKTTEKVSNLPIRLGYTAFGPLPESFFTGTGAKDQGTMPIGAGPFKVTSNSATEIVLEKNPDYNGAHAPKVDKVTYRIYNDTGAAYTDVLANNLDFTDVIPADRLVGDLYKTELDGRNASRPYGGNRWLTFSPVDDQLKGNVKLRMALSMAIDRDTVIKQIFNGSRDKADGLVPSSINGYVKDACGEACVFDAAKAKALYEEAGGYKGTLTIGYNADGDHKAWIEAVANQLKNTLGVNAVAQPSPNFKTYLTALDNDELKGMYTNGWQMDYPSIENFLAPIYGTGADSNYARYSSATFDGLLKQGAAAGSIEEANKIYQQAEAQVIKDFPTAPMWNSIVQLGWSTNVTNVKVDAFGRVDLTQIQRVG